MSASETADSLLCKKVEIPDCADRTVYCTNPPSTYSGGKIDINLNPSSYYAKGNGNVVLLTLQKGLIQFNILLESSNSVGYFFSWLGFRSYLKEAKQLLNGC